MGGKAVYFISDAHLGRSLTGARDRDKHLVDFLDEISAKAESLFILGDLFDFWFEYRCAIRPDYFAVLYALKSLHLKGVGIHYLAGNHDFALGPFLDTQVGIRILAAPCVIQLQGRRLLLAHGDGVLAGDTVSRILQRVLRNPLNQTLYRWVHPDLGIPLGLFFSRLSQRHARKKRQGDKYKAYRRWAAAQLDLGHDMVLFGHTHHAEIVNIRGKVYCNTGHWLGPYTFARLKDGELSLLTYRPGLAAETIPALEQV